MRVWSPMQYLFSISWSLILNVYNLQTTWVGFQKWTHVPVRMNNRLIIVFCLKVLYEKSSENFTGKLLVLGAHLIKIAIQISNSPSFHLSPFAAFERLTECVSHYTFHIIFCLSVSLSLSVCHACVLWPHCVYCERAASDDVAGEKTILDGGQVRSGQITQ